jgi:hypothetical protein
MLALRRDWIGCDSGRHLKLDLDRSAFLADAGSIAEYGIELVTYLAVMTKRVMGVELLRSPPLAAVFVPFRSGMRRL